MDPRYRSDGRVPTVLLLNPNSSAPVTEALTAVVGACGEIPLNIHVDQIDDGPAVIESPEDHAAVLPLVLQRIRNAAADVDAVIIACHGDPGVSEARRAGGPKIIGIGEASMLAACALGGPFGIITLGSGLVERKRSQVIRYGLDGRCAGVSASSTGVLHGLAEEPDIEPYLQAGRILMDSGATSVILGCAGMVRVQSAVQDELGIAVIEPVRAAIGVLLGLSGGTR